MNSPVHKNIIHTDIAEKLNLFINEGKIPNIILGICTGLFIQGILYKDSCDFISNNPYNN